MKKISLKNPTLILIAGVAASGKTTFTEKLARIITDSLVINKDIINEAFLYKHLNSEEKQNYHRGNSKRGRDDSDNFYLKNVRFQSYQCMLDLAKDNLQYGKHPILDGNYAKEIRIKYLDKTVFPFFKDVNCKIGLMYCYAGEETIKKRMIERDLERDHSKLKSEQDWDDFLQQQPIIPPELSFYNHIKINTEESFKSNITNILKYLVSL